ncbi:ATP-dependent helicase HrpB [Verrucomicrobiota bacterium]|nr:ATP-dependent helicase HrpB [Verrucomicrobiota bacterium]
MQRSLPIWQIHAAILADLHAGNRLVLVAPTGSGKTTQVPQMLLDAGLAGAGRIVVLQPRRVAARTVAARVAWERKCKLGDEVGYQIRFEDRTSPGTRISFVTEGVLLRWLQEDRDLRGIGAVLFDEFHERNLLSDVSLALVKRLQETRRPDLKLVVMSATLDAEPVANYLAAPATPDLPCPILISEGQSFPVEVRYQTVRDQRPVAEQAAETIARIINSGADGDVLVFMPGMSEINATINAVSHEKFRERVACIPLHGDLPAEDQDRAFAPNPLRKVVVSTNVAETSVTIDGIRHVVDAGLARVARYDAERGIGTLFLEEISRASADQRKGRAGRTAPGTCHRLWTESGHLNRAERNTPEIQRSDLAEVVLLLHSLGIQRAAEFDWLDHPDPQSVERAEQLLRILGALAVATDAPDRDHDITALGRQMLRLPLHPRYSRMLLEAAHRGCVRDAALCAALVSGRDLLTRFNRDDRGATETRDNFETNDASDFFTLMRAFEFACDVRFSVEECRRAGVHAQTARQVGQTWEQILQIAESHGLATAKAAPASVGAPGTSAASDTSDASATRPNPDALLRCIATGFIDQLCLRRDQGTLECDLPGGRHATLMRESVVQKAPLFVAATLREVETRGAARTLAGLATAVRREWFAEMFPHLLGSRIEHLYDRTHKRVAAVRQEKLLGLVIHREHLTGDTGFSPALSGACLADAHLEGCFELPLFNHAVKQWIGRVNLVAAALPELDFPPINAAAMRECLARAFTGLKLAKDAQAQPLDAAFAAHLAPEQREWLNELAPTSVPWTDDRRLKLLFADTPFVQDAPPVPPEAQVKLHECFTVREHPRLCEDRVPVKLWLCAPDGKRLEATTDWPAFRTTHYPKLRSTLQKKYPGNVWL